MLKPSEIAAIIPMKSLKKAKSRLATHFSDDERIELVSNMLRHVIQTLVDVRTAEIIVVGGGIRIRDISEESGAHWVPEEGIPELNRAVAQGVRRASESELHAFFIPGDLPLLRQADLEIVLGEIGDQTQIAIVPETTGGGTNALYLRRGTPFIPRLGPESFRKHFDQAEDLDLQPKVIVNERIGLDIDSMADLETCEQLEPGIISKLLGKSTSSISS